jgi:hypothetical protein
VGRWEELKTKFICYRSEKYFNWRYSEEVQKYLRKKYPQSVSRKFIEKVLAIYMIRVNEYNREPNKLVRDNVFRVELIDKISIQMGSELSEVGIGIMACVFGFCFEFVKMNVDNSLIKVLEKVGRGFIRTYRRCFQAKQRIVLQSIGTLFISIRW